MKLASLLPPAAFWKMSICGVSAVLCGVGIDLLTKNDVAGFVAGIVGFFAGYGLVWLIWGRS